jgi:hypothetical protein
MANGSIQVNPAYQAQINANQISVQGVGTDLLIIAAGSVGGVGFLGELGEAGTLTATQITKATAANLGFAGKTQSEINKNAKIKSNNNNNSCGM